MFLKKLLIITLLFSYLNASTLTFEKINPTPSVTMLKNQKKAKVCTTPVVADEEIKEDFKYGCFCGKNYPQLDNNQDFRKLNKQERIKLIESYYLIKPYDDIDAICQQHDICYLYQGKRAKVCNDTIYEELHLLVKKFKIADESLQNEQCKNLSYDMASVFTTIFASADDEDSFFDLGMLFFNTSITVANKTFEESVDLIIKQEKRYPESKQKCLIPTTSNLDELKK